MRFLVALCLLFSAVAANDRGFNAAIDWGNNLEESIARGKTEEKPVFILIHKTWCGACKRLKTVFADSAEILHRSKGNLN